MSRSLLIPAPFGRKGQRRIKIMEAPPLRPGRLLCGKHESLGKRPPVRQHGKTEMARHHWLIHSSFFV